ncbi:hypothetical protein BHE74_00015433 [Ensete ventricosum]|nr:hypothetical protein GW17_00045222 [Ensete ventricosum]RWW76478.1 hypothetical protein BHE74_00015433 [Ensete ventricosum]
MPVIVLIFLSSFPTAAIARRRCSLPHMPLPLPATSVPLLPAIVGHPYPRYSSFPATIVARCRCPLPQPPLPPPTTSVPLLPTTVVSHPYHLPSFSRYPHQVALSLPCCTCLLLPASATRHDYHGPRFLLQKIVAVIAALVGHNRCLLPSPPVASSPWPPATSSYSSSRPAVAAKPSSDAPALVANQPLSSSSIATKALNDVAIVLLLYLICLFFPLS